MKKLSWMEIQIRKTFQTVNAILNPFFPIAPFLYEMVHLEQMLHYIISGSITLFQKNLQTAFLFRK